MKCRDIVEDNGVKNVVWFGSYGKEVLANEQQLKITTERPVYVTNTVAGQSFTLTVFGPLDTDHIEVKFYNMQGQLFDSIKLYSDKRKEYYLTGVLDQELLAIQIIDYATYGGQKYPIFTLKEYGLAKKNYVPDTSFNAIPMGVQQANSNFSKDLTAIKNNLIQKLSVMKEELWHNVSFGIPLLQKVKSKVLIDSAVADIILQQKSVISINKFTSDIKNKEYKAEVEVRTNIGNLSINI